LIFSVSIGLIAKTNTIEIDIDISEQYQVIDNFGASDCWSMQKIGEWYTPQKERVADLLFSVNKGIGLSAWRFNIGAGINRTTISHPWRTAETFETGAGQYDWTSQGNERWFLQAAKERGVEQFIAFVNSPPARMTRNGYTNCTDGLGSTNLKDGYEGQFATYLTDILKHFKDKWEIEFDYISPVNEPQWEWNGSNQEGNRASNSDIIAIVEALYDKLQERELNTEISIMESGNLASWYNEIEYLKTKYGEEYGNYLEEVINNPSIKDKIGSHFSGHSYWSDKIEGQLTEDRQALFMKIQPYLLKGWKYWQTEYCILDGPEGAGGLDRDLAIKTALDVARVIHYDLTILRASAWQWWTAVSPEDYKDGLIYTNYKDDPNSQTIIESKLLWAFGNFSRYIRPGSVRINLNGADDKYGLLGSAYLNPVRDQIIIVFVNMGESAEPVQLNISGLDTNKRAFSFTPYVTSDNDGDDLKEYPVFKTDSIYYIPPRSVVTLLGDIEDAEKIDNKDNNIPQGFKLYQNYPNPFNPETAIEYCLNTNAMVNLSVYFINGRKVKTLVENALPAGDYIIPWDGTDAQGLKVGSGIYLYTLQSKHKSQTKKMILIR